MLNISITNQDQCVYIARIGQVGTTDQQLVLWFGELLDSSGTRIAFAEVEFPVEEGSDELVVAGQVLLALTSSLKTVFAESL